MSLSISAPRLFEYFVVCGIGPDIHSLDGIKGYQGMGIKYAAEVLDQYPETDPSLYPSPPPQLSTCVLPAGVEFYTSGYDSNDVSTYPRCYPVVLTEGDGTKIYVSCIAFRDPVCEDISQAYSIGANTFADKCICLVSRSPCFQVLRDAVEELFNLCFSSTCTSKLLWDAIAHMVNNVSVPAPGKELVLFAIENYLLSVEVPSEEGLPPADDVRTDTCVATVGRCPSAVLCMEYNDDTGILAAAGRDAVANIWDIRAGKQMHKLLGHTKWIRSIRMVGDTVVTGSDDWTARAWSVSRGNCDSVLSCHAGPILCVEYSPADKGIITGSIDGLVRFLDNQEGAVNFQWRCTERISTYT